jgi:hypothetical protein
VDHPQSAALFVTPTNEQERNYVYESMRHSERPVLDETDPHGSNHE